MTTKASIPICPFPTYLCITALITASFALSAAAAGIQWGSSPPTSDALQSSWRYVHIALALNTFLLWPAFVLRTLTTVRLLRWDLASLTLAAIPTAGAAAFLSGISLPSATLMLALQSAFALFTLGILAWSSQSPAWQLRAATLLTTLVVVTPILAYSAREFFPAASRAWFVAVPLLTIDQAATATPAPAEWWTAIAYALAGILLIITARRPRHRAEP